MTQPRLLLLLLLPQAKLSLIETAWMRLTHEFSVK